MKKDQDDTMKGHQMFGLDAASDRRTEEFTRYGMPPPPPVIWSECQCGWKSEGTGLLTEAVALHAAHAHSSNGGDNG
jgi:hypothetical protein